jgi:hypothetical protein
VPVLWPRQVSGRPDLYAWEGEAGAATALGLAGGGHRVWIAPSAPDPRLTFEQHLVSDWRYGAETAAARAQQVPITTLEGSIDGTPITLDLVAPQESWIRDEGWVAVARADRYAVTTTGYDKPPERLDFEPLE